MDSEGRHHQAFDRRPDHAARHHAQDQERDPVVVVRTEGGVPNQRQWVHQRNGQAHEWIDVRRRTGGERRQAQRYRSDQTSEDETMIGMSTTYRSSENSTEREAKPEAGRVDAAEGRGITNAVQVWRDPTGGRRFGGHVEDIGRDERREDRSAFRSIHHELAAAMFHRKRWCDESPVAQGV